MERAEAAGAAAGERRGGSHHIQEHTAITDSRAFDPDQGTSALFRELLGSSELLVILIFALALGLCPTVVFNWISLLVLLLTASAALYWGFYFLERREGDVPLDSLLFCLHWTGFVLDLSVGSATLTFLVTLVLLRAFAHWTPDSFCADRGKQWSLLVSLSTIRRVGSLFLSQTVVHFLGLFGLLLGQVLVLKVISTASNETALRTRKLEVYAGPEVSLTDPKPEPGPPSILLLRPEEERPVPVLEVNPPPLCRRQVSHPSGPPPVSISGRHNMRRTSLPAALPLTLQRPNLHHVSFLNFS